MKRETSLALKLAMAAASASVTAALAWCAYHRANPEGRTVSLVDTTERLFAMMRERQVEAAGSDSESYPPPLIRVPLDEETAGAFYPANSSQNWVFDPHTYSVRGANLSWWRNLDEHPAKGWTIETNSLGMRESSDPLEQLPDLRVLVTGDSHTDGVCSTEESFTHVLGGLLSERLPGRVIEALNAGVGGHNLYNYVGTFERLAHLRPHVYVVTVYGGNDFSGAAALQHYFERAPPPEVQPWRFYSGKVPAELASIGPQELSQEVYFLNNPRDVERVADLACSVAVELDRLCTAAGTALFFVYLPPPLRGQPAFFAEELARVAPRTGLEDVELGVSDRIADRWLAFLEDRGYDFLDLRPQFRASESLLYWRTDHHLNVEGHRFVATLLAERLLAAPAPGVGR